MLTLQDLTLIFTATQTKYLFSLLLVIYIVAPTVYNQWRI